MEVVLIHLLKSSALLSIFLVGYLLFLRREDSFQNNRIYLLAGMFSSVFLPFIQYTKTVVREQVLMPAGDNASELDAFHMTAEQGIGLWKVLGIFYLLVTAFLLLKICRELFYTLRLAFAHRHGYDGKYLFINSRSLTAPFSFFKMIVFNTSLHSDKELKMIIEHEKIHVRQWHSLDMLLSNILVAVLWFNPLTWYYKTIVERNLEFLADQETLRVVGNRREYQYALLKISVSGNFPSLMNHFYQSNIKERIRMLGKATSERNHRWKPFLVLPLLLLFLYSFNVNEKIEYRKDDSRGYTKDDQEPLFYLDSSTSDDAIEEMENYFRNNYPDLQLSISGVERNKESFLTGFELRTKFGGEQKFHIRLENKGKDLLEPRFSLQYASSKEGPSLIVKEMGKKELEIKIARKSLTFSPPMQPIKE